MVKLSENETKTKMVVFPKADHRLKNMHNYSESKLFPNYRG